MKNKKSNGAVITGIIAALAASSCCIPPLIAFLAGIGGASSSLSWMEPYRPYLIGLAILAISYAWYEHLNPKKVDDCGCDIEKLKFFQKRGFLIGMTLFAVISISLPFYSHIFYSNKKEVIIVDSKNINTIEFKIDGMTCDACQNHVNYAISELAGIISVNTSYPKENTIVEFDSSKTSIEDIITAINSTGYKTTNHE